MSTLGITHAVDNRNLAAYLFELSKKIRILTDKICCLIKATDQTGITPITEITSAGTANITADFKSITIIKTSSGGTATIHLSDGSTYALTTQGESFTDTAPIGRLLPAYTITTGDAATWKWHGIK